MESRSVLDDSVVKLVFDHFRNLFISSTITGIGFYSGQVLSENGEDFRIIFSIITVLIGMALFIYNFTHIVEKILHSKLSNWWLLLLVLVYLGVGDFIHTFLYQHQFGL